MWQVVGEAISLVPVPLATSPKRLVQPQQQGREPGMARRKKTSPAEDLMDVVAMLPWWAGVGLALVSYLLLHGVASQSVVAATQPGQMGAMLIQTCPRRPNFDHPCRLNIDQGWKAARRAAVCG
jgi:hypothetical protein